MKTRTISLASTLALALAACAPEAETDNTMMADETAMTDEATAPGTIVAIAQGDETFSTLVSAVNAAGLAETLSGDGPFTVFAPTNDAFAKIPAETLTELTTNDTEMLGDILKYHVVEGELNAEAVTKAIADAGSDGLMIETVGGGTLTANVVNGAVVLTDAAGGTATVTATDVDASNGIIHVIDTVLMPA